MLFVDDEEILTEMSGVYLNCLDTA